VGKLEGRNLGYVASFAAAVSWGSAASFAILASLPSVVLTLFRLWLGVLVLVPVLYVTGGRVSRSMIRSSWLGGLFLAGDMAFFFSAIKYTSVVDTTVLGAIQPILVLIVARSKLGERMTRVDVAWVVVALVGVCLTVFGDTGSGSDKPLGDLLAVASAVCWAGYWLVSKRASDKRGALEYTAGVTLVAACVLIPVTLISREEIRLYPARDWFWVCLLALLPGSAHVVMNWAHRHLDASVSSVIGATNPVWAAIAAWAIIGQPLTVLQISGGCVGVTAVAVIVARHGPSLDTS
jgi:drug/metabolite transporter (DMT)-like permease